MIRVCTFGSSHTDPQSGASLADCYVRVEAINEAEIRRIMHERFGNRWSFMYPDEAAAGVEKYGLTEVHLHGEGRPVEVQP